MRIVNTRLMTPFTVVVMGVFVLAGVTSGNANEKCSYPGDVAAGQKVYNGTCIACHGAKGEGTVPGVPNFTKKGGVLSKPHSALVEHIKKGFQSGGGLSMPPRGGDPSLTEQDLANVHAYLHSDFGCG